jgi:hypothetical protein
MKNKKILHIFNTAGVSNVLNYFLNSYPEKHNFSSKLITRLYYETFGFSEYYNDKIFKRRDEIFYAYLLLIAKKYDILHLNTTDKFLPFIRKAFKNKKIILSYHGTDIRGKVNEREEYYKHADFVSVSTKELSQDKFEYIPNIIDFNHFNLKDNKKIIRNEALFLYLGKHEIEAYEKVKKLLKSHYKDLNLTVHKRWEDPIPYKNMPKFLSKFEYYFDIKMVYSDKKKLSGGYLTTHEHSYTANQFLTMNENKKVIIKDGSITTGFTKEKILKDNFKLLDRWIEIYENI